MEASSQRQAPTTAPRAPRVVDIMMRALEKGASVTAFAAMAACGSAFEAGSVDATQNPTTTDAGITGQGGRKGTGGTQSTGGHLEGGSGGGTGGTTGTGGHPEGGTGGGTGGTTGTGGHLEDGGSTGGAGGTISTGGHLNTGGAGGNKIDGGNVDAGSGGTGGGGLTTGPGGNGGATTGSGGTGGGLTTGPGGNGGGGIITTGSGGADGGIEDAGGADAGASDSGAADAGDAAADAAKDAEAPDAGPAVCKPACPAPINPDCQKIACVDLNGAGICAVTENTPDGTAISKQIAGDCNTVICDGSGGVENQINDLDVKANSNLCVTESCNQGQPIETLNNGAACKTPTGVVCDKGNCVTKPEEMTTYGDFVQAVEFAGNCNNIADVSDGFDNPIHYTKIQKIFTGENPTSKYVMAIGKDNNNKTDLIVSFNPGAIKNKNLSTLSLASSGPYTKAQIADFCNGVGFTTINLGLDNNSGFDSNPDPDKWVIAGKAGSESQVYLIQSN